MKVKGKRKVDYKTISMSKKLYDRLDEIIDGTGFANVSQFVSFVMRLILSENVKDNDLEKKVKKKLRSLGYIE